jgi:outer membrane immunogenic protein
MRAFFLAGVAICGLCGAANAADLATKVPVAAPPPPFNWTGIYIGGFVGGAIADRNANSTEPYYGAPTAPGPQFYNAPGAANNYSLPTSFLGGFTGGVNYQPGVSNWVFGVEGEVGYLHLARSVIDVNSVPFGSDSTDRTRIGDWYGALTGRVGYAFDRVLFYGKGGAAFVSKSARFIDNCGVAPCSVNKLINLGTDGSQFTWAAGAGIEYAITDNWSLKGEYLYLNARETFTYTAQSYNNAGTVSGVSYTSTHTDPGVHTAKIGLNYRWSALH